MGTFNLLESVRQAHISAPLIYSSTNKVYGELKELRVVRNNVRDSYESLPYGVSEDQNLDFHSPHGCSKGAADQYFIDYHRVYGKPTIVFRQSCIYGYRQFGLEDRGWVAWFMIASQLGRPITVHGDGRQVRDILFIDDLLDAFDAAFAAGNAAHGRVYNIGGGPDNVLSVREVLAYIERRQQRKLQYHFDNWRPGDQKVFVSDIWRAQTELGWTPKVRWSQGLDLLYDWVSQKRRFVSMRVGAKLRILHVGKFYPPRMGGIETHLHALCGELRKVSDVSILVASEDSSDKDEVVEDVPVLRAGTILNLASAPFCPTMTSRIRASEADLVHLHLPNPPAILAYLASGHPGPLILTYHSDTIRHKLLGALFQPFLHAALRRSSAIIVTSPNYLRTSPVLTRYRARCKVIPHGIHVADFERPDRAAVEHLRQQYGDRIVISVGRLVYYKGFEYLIQSMTRVEGRLLIVGDGPLRKHLEDMAISLGVSGRIVFLGEIQNSKLVPCYHAADVFALASVSRAEAFGIVQLEAMACGKPVVNTSLPSGVPFVSLDGITGITVPPANPEALAKAINSLLDDPIRRAQYGNAARRRVQAKFNLELMTRRTLRLYQRVMQSPNTSPKFRGQGSADLDSGMGESALDNTASPGSKSQRRCPLGETLR